MDTPLTKHLALVGFMGAGKTTVGLETARRTDREFVDVDQRIVDELDLTIPEIFERHGEARFRQEEVVQTILALGDEVPAVLSLGGGAVESPEVREALAERAIVLWLDVDVETCWRRAQGPDRPLAQSEREFRERYERRWPLYEQVADVTGRDADDAALAAAGVHVEHGALVHLGELVPGEGPVALVFDPHVAGIHGADAQLALGRRLASTHALPLGEEAKQIEAVDALWNELAIPRRGCLVALGGGCTTDAAGFAAATYLRGIPWVPVPSSLVGQVDAAIGGKTAVDLAAGKNLVGAFHWPARVVVDPALLETLPAEQRREGMAEVVKTGLLANEPLWELPDDELVRRCAAFKSAVCLRDPRDAGERNILNLGHTFAHALEAAADYEGLTHGRAVALGLLAALRLSGRPTDVVEEVLEPKRAHVDRERAWTALGRDKKTGLVLLDDDGPRWNVQLPPDDVRRALDDLIAG